MATQTENLNLTKPDGTDPVDIAPINGNMDILDEAVAGKVDKVPGKDLSANDYTDTEKSTVAENRAILVELVDEGAKNVLTIPESVNLQDEVRTSAVVNEDGTIDVTVLSALPNSRTIYYFVTISEGDYVFSCGAESSTAQDSKYDCYISDTSTSPATTLIRDNSADPGNSAHIAAGTYRVTIRLRTAATVGVYRFKPMLCSQAKWAISQAYQPYRPSWQEMSGRSGGSGSAMSMSVALRSAGTPIIGDFEEAE